MRLWYPTIINHIFTHFTSFILKITEKLFTCYILIKDIYRPVERVELLLEYKVAGKITADEFETMTGLPYNFGM